MEIKLRARFASLLVLSALPIIGCASGPTDDTQLSDLEDEALVQLCNDHRLRWEPSVVDYCEREAVPMSADETECATARDECIAIFDGQHLVSDATECAGPRAGFPADCRARVGIFRECMEYLNENLEQHFAYAYSCEEPLTLMGSWPAACELFNDSCPGYLEAEYGEYFTSVLEAP